MSGSISGIGIAVAKAVVTSFLLNLKLSRPVLGFPNTRLTPLRHIHIHHHHHYHSPEESKKETEMYLVFQNIL